MGKDPFFDDSLPDPGPPPEGLWAIQKDLPAKVSIAENAKHEWELTNNLDLSRHPQDWVVLARYQYRCRRCGFTIVCPPWEDPFEDDGTEVLQDQTCTEIMLADMHNS